MRRAWLPASALLALAAPPSRAQTFELRGQAQVIALGAMSLPDPSFGLVELQANASVWSLGVALGVAYERFPTGDNWAHGGEFHAAFQWRFMSLLDDQVFAILDPHIDLGFVLGGGRAGDDSWFRGAGYGGVGLDIGLTASGDDTHAVFTVQYRWSPTGVHAPDAAPDHLLLLGIGLRITDAD